MVTRVRAFNSGRSTRSQLDRGDLEAARIDFFNRIGVTDNLGAREARVPTERI